MRERTYNVMRRVAVVSIATFALISVVMAEDATPHSDSEHEGHAHEAAEGGRTGAPNRIPVTQEQVARLGIKISRAVRGAVHQEVRVPGEIKINTERVAHVVPRAGGIVREVTKSLGARVEVGDTLAWVESDALAEAKLDFYAKEAEVGCCLLKLPRSKAIYENVSKLMTLLKRDAPREEIQKLNDLEMGTYRGQLLTAYAAFRSARTTHEREVELHADKISSGQDLLAAETALTQAQAEFEAAVDTASYETLINYTDAAQEQQVAVFDAFAAERRLRLKGVDDAVVEGLRALVPKIVGLEPCPCDDPTCKEGELPSVKDALGKDGRFAWYALRSPFAGTLIAKHIVMGESVGTESEVFTVADMSSVWIDLVISQESMLAAEVGHLVTIRLPDGVEAEAKIDFVSPIVAQATRTALARATLDNAKGRFRPGTFVEAAIQVPSAADAVVIPKSSLQLVDDYPCVFVWTDAAFELREVKTGGRDGTRVEILEGVRLGDAVASENAFHLKAEYVKSMAGERGAHQGHSH